MKKKKHLLSIIFFITSLLIILGSVVFGSIAFIKDNDEYLFGGVFMFFFGVFSLIGAACMDE